MNCFSNLWNLKLSDWERGLIVAILTAPIGILYDWAIGSGLHLDWHALLKGAIAGGLAYIGKNLLTGVNGRLLTNAPPVAKLQEVK